MHAHAQCQQERYAEALEQAERAVAAAPDIPYGYRVRSMALLGLGYADEAIAAAAEGTRLAPQQWLHHEQLVQACMRVPEQRTRGYAAARRAVELAPDEAQTHFLAGFAAHSLDRREEAQVAYERVLALDPEHATALNNLSLLAAADERSLDASSYLSAALRADPQNTAAHGNIRPVAGKVALNMAATVALVELAAGLVLAAVLGLEYLWSGFVVLRRLLALPLVLFYVAVVRFRFMEHHAPYFRRAIRAELLRSPATVVATSVAVALAAVTVAAAVLPFRAAATVLLPVLAAFVALAAVVALLIAGLVLYRKGRKNGSA